jgi:hypothetical protein
MLKAPNFDTPIVEHDLYCAVEVKIGRHLYLIVKDPDGAVVRHYHPKERQQVEILLRMLNRAYDHGHRDGRVEGRGEYDELEKRYNEIAK